MIEFGPYRLDAPRRVVWKGEELLPIAPKAAEILAALAERAGQVVTKDELLAFVWPGVFVEEANLSVNVSALRKALGTQSNGQPYIQTVHRRGYRFVGPVRRATRPGPPVLAVLPFACLGAKDAPSLGAGMADAVITRLGRTGRVIVRSTSAVLKYAGPRDPLAAGRELAADAVLDGALQRQRDRLRLSVQLVPLAERLRPWAAAFDEPYRELLDVEQTVAEKVAAALELELTADERERLTARSTRDLAAYEAYARGRHFWNRFSAGTLRKAFAAFQEATERDPTFAAPHAGLADLFVVSGFSRILPPRDAWRLAGEAADRALALDPDLAEAHVAKAYVRLFDSWDFAAAEKDLGRALVLDPNSAATHQWCGLLHATQGRLEAFEAELFKARALDPTSLVVESMEALLASLLGDPARELRCASRAVELDPHHFVGHWALGLALLRQLRGKEAVAAHRKALDLAEDAPIMRAVLARTLAVAGRRREARALLAGLEGREDVSPYQLATVDAALGARPRALSRLAAAVEGRDPWLVWLRVDPMLSGLRRTARFRSLVRRVFGRG
ncbi:MAG TPA: winged helix-turn-helix domain-containing protein [Vicinamibacteria bacterium]|nr:winged helix-turn-helix domain-containing protein [Vicinamibacteria bacterium]